MDSLTSLISLIIIMSTTTILLGFIKPARNRRRLPPSPLKLPIIGNLHQLSSLPHQSLHSLAKKHGHLMLLHFGSVPVLIVSSAGWAHEIMKTHDLIFANRPAYKAFRKLLYGCRDLSTAPYGEYWRQMKSIVVLQLLSNRRVQSFRWIREEETAILVKKIEECSGPVDLSKMFAEFTSDVIGRSAFERRYSESDDGKKFLRVMHDFMELLGFINVGDFIPWLDWIGRVNGFDERLDRIGKEMDAVLESLIQERLVVTRNEQIGESFLDILVEIYKANTGYIYWWNGFDMHNIGMGDVGTLTTSGYNGKAATRRTFVMINACRSIGRDPNSWDKPEEFMPERFLNSSIDFKGQDFDPVRGGTKGMSWDHICCC